MPTFSATISGWYCQPMNCIGSAGAAAAEPAECRQGRDPGHGRGTALQHGAAPEEVARELSC